MRRGIPEIGDFVFSPYHKNLRGGGFLHLNNIYVDPDTNIEMGSVYDLWGHRGTVPLKELSLKYRSPDFKFQPGDKVRNMLCFGEVIEVRTRFCIGDIINLYWVTFYDQLLMENEIWKDE